MTSKAMKLPQDHPVTLGDALASVTDLSTVTGANKSIVPAKPQVRPTEDTPFELIEVSVRIRTCAGCRGDLTSDNDNKWCLRHKENDFVLIQSQNYWKKTFDNKHYHVEKQCVVSRNPNFRYKDVRMKLKHTVTGGHITYLREKLGNEFCQSRMPYK